MSSMLSKFLLHRRATAGSSSSSKGTKTPPRRLTYEDLKQYEMIEENEHAKTYCIDETTIAKVGKSLGDIPALSAVHKFTSLPAPIIKAYYVMDKDETGEPTPDMSI